MPPTTNTTFRALPYQQQKGRALNAVAELLRKKLSVPNIYLNPPSSIIAVDVLAVDGAGSGDLHGVLIKLEKDFKREPGSPKEFDRQTKEWRAHFRKKVKDIHDELLAMPAHFRYLALPQGSWDDVAGELGPVLYSPDGIGRIGIINLVDRGEEPPLAELSSITPERFRLDATSLSRIEKRLISNSKVRPDIEVRI